MSERRTDDDLRAIWRSAGGRFHGPTVETGTMPESQLLLFLRSIIQVRDTDAARADRLTPALATEKAARETAERQVAGLTDDLNRLTRGTWSKELARLTADLTALREQNERLERERDEALDKIVGYENRGNVLATEFLASMTLALNAAVDRADSAEVELATERAARLAAERERDHEHRRYIDSSRKASDNRNRAESLESELTALRERVQEVEKDYSELIMAVAKKWHGETRHATALRYIQLAEAGSPDDAKAAQAFPDGGKA